MTHSELSKGIRREWLNQAHQIKAQGFRVFVSPKGNYGLFTDPAGRRVCGLQYDLFTGMQYSGEYKALTHDGGRQIGQGWRITEDVHGSICNDVQKLQAILTANAPRWAVHDTPFQYKTLEDHMRLYKSSSDYIEI